MGWETKDSLRDSNATFAALNQGVEDAAKTYQFSITTSDAAYGPVTAGRYKVKISAGSSADYVAFLTAASASTPVVPAFSSSGSLVNVVDGDECEIIVFPTAKLYLWAKGSAALTLRLQPMPG